MTDQQKIIALAKLDGWTYYLFGSANDYVKKKGTDWKICPRYLTSRDAIVVLMEKSLKGDGDKISLFWTELNRINDFFEEHGHVGMLFSTPSQLSEALLRALNLWEE